MKLPNADKVIVSQTKLFEYLLAEDHPQGRHEAAFFMSLGFTREAWRILASALARHPREHEVSRIEDSRFGTRYVIEGTIEAPKGGESLVRTVWFIDLDGETPRLVTAYPLLQEHL
jgi:hypothetical protein